MNLVGRMDVLKGQQLIEETLHNGAALSCFEKMLVHQNVDIQLAADLCSGKYQLAKAKYITPIPSPLSGKNK